MRMSALANTVKIIKKQRPCLLAKNKITLRGISRISEHSPKTQQNKNETNW
jgi:hypothetical protein